MLLRHGCRFILAALLLAGCAASGPGGPEYLGGYARAIAWSPDGAVLVAVGRTDLHVFDGRSLTSRHTIATLDPAAPYQVHRRAASLAFARAGDLAATAAFDAGVTLWDAATWQRALQIPATQAISAVTFAGDSQQLVGAGATGPLAIWDARSGLRLATLLAEPSGVLTVAVSADGKWLAAGTLDGHVVLWDLPSRTVVARSPVQPGGVLSVAFAPDGTHLASSAQCVDVRLWDTQGGMTQRPVIDVSRPSPAQTKGQALLGLAALVSNVASFRSIHAPSGALPSGGSYTPTQFDCQIAFSADGALLGVVHHAEEFSGSYHTEVFEVASGALLARMDKTMSGVAFRADGALAATSGILHVIVFDPRSGVERASVP